MVDISIIIPTFNRLWSLPETVQSCRGSSAEVEIIVVDDGSTDGTWDWLRTQTDVISIRQDNLGKDWAVNNGFSKATGEFVRFLDSDDLLPPQANDVQLATGRQVGADVVVAGYTTWDQKNDSRNEIAWTDCDDFIAQQLGECDSSHYSAYLFRRSFIADVPHRQDFAFRDDRMFVIEAALKEPRVCAAGIPCLIHRHHSADRLQFQHGLANAVCNWQHWNIYKRASRILEERGELTLRRRRAMVRVLWPLAHWIAYTHLDEACRLVTWIYELDPEFVPPKSGGLGFFYRNFGFPITERILKTRRILLQLFS